VGGSWWTPVFTAVLSGAVLLILQLFIMPRLERAKTIEQELWRAKRDAFIGAMKLMDRHLNYADWRGSDVPAGYIPDYDQVPKSDELNEIISLLVLLSDNVEIGIKFGNMFKLGMVFSPADRTDFLVLLRKELFRKKTKIDRNKVPFIFRQDPDQLRAAVGGSSFERSFNQAVEEIEKRRTKTEDEDHGTSQEERG
jgi:hypothetical protein